MTAAPAAAVEDDRGAAPVETAPLSARQSLLWLDDQLHPDARYHNMVLTADVRGALDVPRLVAAWRDTVLANDAFWTVVDPGVARQTWRQADLPPLPVIDVEPGALAGWVAAHAGRPLVGEGLRWEAALLRLGPERHVLFLLQHHLISDGPSMLVLLESLGARYQGEDPPRGPSFRDYLAQEARYRASSAGTSDREHWSRTLPGSTPPLRLYGIPRTDRSTAIERLELDAGRDRAERLAARAETDLFRSLAPPLGHLVVLATALVAFLHRVTGDRDILLGVPTGNRPAPFGRTCGLLMEQIFLGATVEEGDSFATVAGRVGDSILQGLAHGRACVSDRGMHHVTLNLLPERPTTFAGLPVSVALLPAPAVEGAADGAGDLRDSFGLVVHDFGRQALRLALDFHRATFDEALRKRAASHFLRILDALLVDPEARIDAVDLLDEAERRTILAAARGSEGGGQPPDLLVTLAAQAARRPGQVAVVAPDATLSYAELEVRTNQLARRLRQLGVTHESRVGVAVPRGAGELASLLATLKAGGAYVPVDPSHPVERVRLILEDAAPEVLIAPSDSPLAAAMPPGTRHLVLDDLEAATSGVDPAPLPASPGADDLAYILFTSGSTGRPKGVEVRRGAFANFLRSMAHTPGLGPEDRLLAITTTTFDIAGLELYLPLWVGATVTIADRETALDPERLRRRLEAERFTVLQATPATWRLLLEAGWQGDPGLRMFIGGEALNQDLAAQLLARGGELWNLYGPTETTVWSTLDRVAPGDRITIGRPIDRTQIYVLDPARKLVPAGVVGELYIGGDGLARGYRGRPDLTDERFVPDPWGGPGARMYRTGDLGRLLSDGRFECLGRVDHQVKIRGFRIELGEIESALRAVPGVQEAVVVAEAQGSGDPRLVAYWVGGAGRDDLFAQARRKVPPYMIPTAYVPLERFPLTTSGKVDRKALPRAEAAGPVASTAVLPRNDLETRVAAIWSELLGVAPVGIDQDFFSLGGTSVLAIQARARIEEALGVELPLRAFFEAPTIEGMVARLGSRVSGDEPIVVRLRKGQDGKPPLFCLLGVQLYQDLALALEDDRPVYGIHVPIHYVAGHEPCPPVPDIASRYVTLIRELQPVGPYHLAGLCFGGLVAFEAARQLEAGGQEVPVVAVLDAYMPGAVRVNQLGRLRGWVWRAIRDPAAAWSRLERLLGRVRTGPEPVAARPAKGSGVEALPGLDRTEVPIDGPEVDVEALRYGRMPGTIGGRLLLFRAIGRGWPAWMSVAPDLGWTRRARHLSARDVDCGHLDIVRGEHARTVARAIGAALEEGPPTA